MGRPVLTRANRKTAAAPATETAKSRRPRRNAEPESGRDRRDAGSTDVRRREHRVDRGDPNAATGRDAPETPPALGRNHSALAQGVADGTSVGRGATDIDEAGNQREKLSPDMQSAFLRFRKSQLAQRSSRVALALSKLMLMRIRLPYPRHIEAMAEIEELRLLGLEMRGEQQLALNIFSRTGTGKSTVASQYKLMRAQEDPEGVQSVLHARLGTSGSARDLYVSIMAELGDGFASSGTEHTLRRRAMRAMAEAGVELLILDETQHSGQKSGFSREVTAELKIMLDTGRVPIVLLGTETAVPLVGADRELSGRMFSPCRLDPLDMADDEDFELWQGFLDALDNRMVSNGIVAAPAGLTAEDLAAALGEVCDGVIGQVMRVMTMALRNTIRERRQVITVEDIAIAVDEWSLEHGFAATNPLRGL